MCFFCGNPGLVHPDGSVAPPGGDVVPGSDGTQRAGSGSGDAGAGQPTGSISQLATYLISGYWTSVGTVAHHWSSNTITYNLGNLNSAEQSLALNAMALWSQVANITFVASGSANINFNHNGNMTAFTSGSWYTSGQMISATVDISSNWITNDGGAYDGRTGIYSYGFQTYIHEIGHALGLGHQGPYNGSATYGTSNIYANDTWQYSVMSYFSQPHYNGGSYDYVITPQMADIAAVQSIYGAATTRTGNTTYGFNSTAGSIFDFSQYTAYGTPAFTIYDSGGTDTIDASGYWAGAVIDLTPGAFSSIGGYTHNIGIYTTTIIEAAIGGQGNDAIIGNSGNNTLIGSGGGDTINGGDGTDTVVYGGMRSQYQATQNPNGSIHIVDLRGGAPDGSDDVSNVEFFQFADGTTASAGLFNQPPVVVAPNYSVSRGQVVSASSLFSATDAENDTITQYQFWDATADALSGHLVVNGVAQGVNQAIDVTASQLAQTTFQSGVISDYLYVRAFDGTQWSVWTEFHVNPPPNQVPAIAAADVSASHNRTIAASALFAVSDADNDAIISYQFWDATADATSGHWSVNGVAQGVNQIVDVAAGQLAQATFLTGSTSDDLYVRAFDGIDWSAWRQFHVNVPANQLPVVTVSDYAASHNQTIAASALFAVSDADNDAIISYQFWDATANATSGHWSLNGVAQGVNQIIDVAAGQLAQTTFQTGSTSDDLYVRAFDGSDWSAWRQFHVNVPVNQLPMVTVSDYAASHNQTIAASALFAVSDADNDAIISYQFWDATANATSGHWSVNAAVQGVNQIIDVAAGQLAQTTFQTGSTSDDLYVRAFDGSDWSAWRQFHVNVPVNQLPVLTVSDYAASHNQTIAASALFAVSDADNDTMTQYQLWDATANATSGHWVVNGAAQGVNQIIGVTASQLTQTMFQSGSGSDDLFVRAFDGFDWSTWTEFHVNAPVNQVPVVTANTYAASHNQNVAASSLFSVSDADNDTMMQYQFWDATTEATSGHWVVNGAAQGVNQIIGVTASQLAQTTFQSGSGADDLFVRAFDGFDWSAWTEFHVNAPSNDWHPMG